MPIKFCSILLLILLNTGQITVLGSSSTKQSFHAAPNITRLIETRAGQSSCWGVTIEAKSFRFKRKISNEQIIITEDKYGSDLKKIMSWHVELGGRRLIIKFKPGMGDFGIGNRMRVILDRSSVINLSDSIQLSWVIDTDIP